MFKINKLGVILLNILLLAYDAHSAEERKEIQEEGADILKSFNQPGKPFPPPLAKITFPNEKEKLIEEIAKGSPCLYIYIPNGHSTVFNQKTIDFPACTPLNLENLQYLVINHSLGSERGYQSAAVNTLISLVKNALKLEQLTLSQALADDFLPHVRPNTNVILDCGCSHSANDTLFSKDYLVSLSNGLLQYYQKQYPQLQISTLEIKGFINTTSSAFLKSKDS